MSILYKAAGWGSIFAILALIVTFLKQIIALVGQLLALISFFMFAVKIIIVLAFIAVIAGVGFLVFRSWKASRQPKS
ncbi:MAG: hypothetical protein LH472_02315 [Pyrinomonadaceae bacterium]|nr:hypothetical protein [Pyrinomonadaceae bacterium]